MFVAWLGPGGVKPKCLFIFLIMCEIYALWLAVVWDVATLCNLWCQCWKTLQKTLAICQVVAELCTPRHSSIWFCRICQVAGLRLRLPSHQNAQSQAFCLSWMGLCPSRWRLVSSGLIVCQPTANLFTEIFSVCRCRESLPSTFVVSSGTGPPMSVAWFRVPIAGAGRKPSTKLAAPP